MFHDVYFIHLLCRAVSSTSSSHARMSPGWQFNSLQMASSVLNRMALALPVFRMERFAGVIPTRSESSFKEIFFLAISTSRFTMIGICSIYLDGEILSLLLDLLFSIVASLNKE